MTKQKKWFKRIGLALLALVLVLAAALAGYAGWPQSGYYRIPDGETMEITTPQLGRWPPGRNTPPSPITSALGPTGPDYSFFMDTGTMADGTPVQGKWGKARNRESVLANTRGALRPSPPRARTFCFCRRWM